MPKITVHGGASNAREAIDDVPAPGESTSPAERVRNEEDPTAPAGRPGEHAQFFADQQPASTSEGDEHPTVEPAQDAQDGTEEPARDTSTTDDDSTGTTASGRRSSRKTKA